MAQKGDWLRIRINAEDKRRFFAAARRARRTPSDLARIILMDYVEAGEKQLAQAAGGRARPGANSKAGAGRIS